MPRRADLKPGEAHRPGRHRATLDRDGLTNAEIGARLFLSHHTIEWHLRKVFSKLGIASRREIPTLPSHGGATPA